MNRSYHDLMEAIRYLQNQLAVWRKAERLSEQQAEQLFTTYEKWANELAPNLDYTGALPAKQLCLPSQEPYAAELQQLQFVQQELRRQVSHSRLTPGQVQLLSAELAERMKQVEQSFAEVLMQGTSPNSATKPAEPVVSRSLIEYLVDPRSLQALMMTGGGLLVLGLVLWLWSCGVFEDPKVLAYCLGGANLAVLAGGVTLVRKTRYQLAGQGMTLLACLVLPLNLWFYSAQGLITIEGGGHLWVPAVLVSALYAGVARLLRDSKFVYALVGGVTMTGLLFLADSHVAHFWEIIAPSTFLVVLGSVCVHAERLFNENDGPFSRQKFGKAFFVSGHVVMAAGLLVLLGGRLVGWFYEPYFASHEWFLRPDVSYQMGTQLWALALAMLGTYTYLYSQVAVDAKGRRYAHSAVLTLLWCEVMLVDLLPMPRTESVALLVLGSTGLAALLLTSVSKAKAGLFDMLSNLLGGVGAVCTVLATAWGSVALFRTMLLSQSSDAYFQTDVFFGLAMGATALACTVAAWVRRDQTRAAGGVLYAYLLAVPFVGLVATALLATNALSLAATLVALAAVPVVLELATLRAKPEGAVAQLTHTSLAATLLLLVLSMGSLMDNALAPASTVHALNAGFFALVAGTMGLSALRRRQSVPTVLSVVCGSAAAWQLFTFVGMGEYSALVAAGVAGLATMAMAKWQRDESAAPNALLSNVGLGLVSAGAAGGLFLTTGRVVVSEVAWPLVTLCASQAVVAGVASLLTSSKEWKRGTRLMAGLHLLAMVLVVNVLSGLSMMQRGELLVTAAGLLLVGAGHLRWRHESDEHHDPMVDLQLTLGSLLAAGPLVFGLLAQRFSDYDPVWGFALMHELGALSVGLMLLGAGVVCRIRSTTFTGSLTLVAWIVSLVGLVHLPELQGAAVAMMVGGGAFFTVAVLLSVYRDRLLSLPQKIRNREGMFRVLEWR